MATPSSFPLVRLAWRNLTRHTTRNVLLGSSIGATTGLLAFVLCVGDGVRQQLLRSVVDSETGAVTIEMRPAIRSLPAATRAARVADARRFALAQPGVRGVRDRVTVRALMYANNKSADVQLVGLHGKGEAALAASMPLLAGRFVSADQPGGVTIGEPTAERLGLSVGDECVLMTQTVNGAMNVMDCRVAGIVRATSRWANGAVYSELGLVERLYDVDVPTQLLVDSDRLDDAATLATTIRAGLRRGDTLFTVGTFRSRAGLASSIANVTSVSLAVLVACLLVIAAVGVSSAMIANVADRVGEIGTLSALGFTRGEILRTLLLETVALSTLSAAAGLALAAIVVVVVGIAGVDIGATASLAFGVRTLRPQIAANNFIIAGIVAMTLPLVFAYLPARRGARLDPVEALRASTV